MNIEVPFTGLTWGELRAFVRLGAAMEDDDDVDFATGDTGDTFGLAMYGLDASAVANGS